MRITVSENTMDRMKDYLKSRHPEQHYWTEGMGSNSPGYTAQDCIEEMLRELGF